MSVPNRILDTRQVLLVQSVTDIINMVRSLFTGKAIPIEDVKAGQLFRIISTPRKNAYKVSIKDIGTGQLDDGKTIYVATADSNIENEGPVPRLTCVPIMRIEGMQLYFMQEVSAPQEHWNQIIESISTQYKGNKS